MINAQSPASARLRTSFYNVIVPHTQEGAILFNSLSGALFRVSTQMLPRLQTAFSGNLSSLSDEEIETLLINRFLIDEDTDELTLLKARNWLGRMRGSDFTLSILLTLDCNFACRYCFEQRRAEHLGQDTEQRIYRFVAEKARRCDLFSVDWYGGEPLTQWTSLRRMNDRISHICKAVNCEYEVSITTNGYLLRRDIVEYLRQFRVSHLQITLDGPPEVHDRLRPTRSGEGTFSRILQNIQHAAEYLPITIRINTLEENIQAVGQLIEVLEDAGLRNKVLFLIKAVVSSPANPCEDSCLSPVTFSLKAIEQYRRAFERGWVIFPNIEHLRTYEFCIADSANHFLVDPHARLYKCGERFTIDESVGYIRDDGHEVLNFERWANWVARDPFAYQECVECKILPLCMGGCSMKRFWKKKDWCLEVRHNLDKFLQLVCMSQERMEEEGGKES